jgi:gustatory receptor
VLKVAITVEKANNCQMSSKFKAFLKVSQPGIYLVFGDNLFVNIIARLSGYLVTLMGSFRDLFVMCISVALAARFQQVNKILLQHKGISMPPSFFFKQRLYHRKLATLVSDIDNAISSITLLALGNNLFSICTSLLNSL